MSRARRAPSSPVSLFPFLAVLVSTIGALILLLLAINRQTTLRAVHALLDSIARHADSELEQFDETRNRLTQELATARDKLTALVVEERTIDERLRGTDEQIRQRVDRITAVQAELQQLLDQRQQAELALSEIRQQLDALDRAKTRLADEQPNADRTFTPVVHAGSYGTTRRPIYIECTGDRVIIQPEQIPLPARALAAGRDDNALARAVRALSVYLVQRDQLRQASTESVATPYPVLLVRPNGIGAYYAARAALEWLDVPFGYELLDADWLLRYPEPDAEARAVALAALSSPRPHPAGSLGAIPGPGVHATVEPDGVALVANSPVGRGAEPIDDSAADHPQQLSRENPEGRREQQQPANPRAERVGAKDRDSTPDQDTHEAAPHAESSLSRGDTSGPIPIPRKIYAECTANRLLIWPDAREIELPASGQLAEPLAELADEIAREVATWGPAGTTLRWQPQLICRVHADGLEAFYRLRFALAGGPVQIDHECAFDCYDASRGSFLSGSQPSIPTRRDSEALNSQLPEN
jgi:hypothetical protein